jgi:hypothetical protein
MALASRQSSQSELGAWQVHKKTHGQPEFLRRFAQSTDAIRLFVFASMSGIQPRNVQTSL